MFRRVIARFQQPAAPLSAAVAQGVSRPPLDFQGGKLHGFTLTNTRPIEDLHLVVYECTHDRTGAKYFHIDSEDPNNAFCIGFRTPAQNDKGTTHVLEHTVLCGSKKYPIRDPFFKMLRRSLSTFMNAMTGADYTLYPFATTNKQDYANLLDIYLDAVFNPLLRLEDFKQEGHRVETAPAGDAAAAAGEEGVEAEAGSEAAAKEKGEGEATDAAQEKKLIYNGVVYNEMRGVVSEPSRFFSQSVMKTMLPGTHYEHISGGYPISILDLTHSELVSFHRDHYNPSNSVTFSYGCNSPYDHMKLLDQYFSAFDKRDPVTVPRLSPSKRFSAPKNVALKGPVDSMGDPSKQKRVMVAFGVKDESNQSLESVVQLSVLHSLLSSGPSSPMYKALIESQIGSRFAPMTEYAFYFSTPTIAYGVEGIDDARPNAEEEVQKAVLEALQRVQSEGFDPRRVESVVFQEELQQRHRAADYGVNLSIGLCALGLCRNDLNPVDNINWLPHLRRVGGDVKNTVLPQLSSNLLENPHRATITVSASEEYLDTMRNEITERENKMTQAATAADVQKLDSETSEWLKRVRAPEDLSVLPSLHVSDIPRKAFLEPIPVESAANANVSTIGHPTNGLVYVHGVIPFDAAFKAKLTAANGTEADFQTPMLHGFLGKTGAAGMSYKDLSIQIDLTCAGFSFAPIVNNSYSNRDAYITGTSFGFYTTQEKLHDALELLRKIISEPHTNFTDEDVRTRILSMAKARCSRQIQSILHTGNSVAMALAASRLTTHSAIRERWGGLSQSNYSKRVLSKLQSVEGDVEVRTIIEQYAGLTKSLQNNMHGARIWATCEKASCASVEGQLNAFISAFANGSAEQLTDSLTVPTTTASGGAPLTLTEKLRIDTSFVGLAIPNKLDWLHADQAPLRVAAQLLRNEFLHRRVREEGGAYGSSASATLPGEVGGVTMSSYRDPTPDKTQAAFSEAAAWLSDSKNVTASGLEEAKLCIFSTIDAPYAPDSYGQAKYLLGGTPEIQQGMRDRLLATTAEQVVNSAKYFDVNGSNAVFAVLRPASTENE